MNTCDELEFIIERMKVTSIHGLRATSGYALELTYPEKNLFLKANVLEGAPAFESLSNIKKGEHRLVVGQLPVNSRVLKILDIHC